MRAADRREAGETLLETVIAIAIVGIAFVALLGGVLLGSAMSGLHRGQAEGNNQLITAIEQVQAAPYVPTCAATNPLYPVTLVAGWTYTEAVTYWDGSTNTFGAVCYDNLPLGYLTHQVTLSVHSADGRVNRTETFLKRG